MAYTRKVATDKLKTFGYFVVALWETVNFLSKDAQCTDIVFDLHLKNTAKYGASTRR